MRTLLLALVLLAAVAKAQAPAQGTSQVPGTPPPAEGTASEPPAQEPPRKADVPDAEKLTRSAEVLKRMRVILKDVLNKLEEARASKDVVKLNCVNEKLTQIKGLLRITEQADVALQEAISRQEPQAAEHEYLKVTIAAQKVEQLRAEAEECIGQLAFRTDERQEVTVEEPEGLPDDPTSPKTPRGPVIRPPPASPTL